jgi:phytoene synthase
MVGEARRRFALAHDAMAHCEPRAMRPARLMGATYGALLERLVKRGWTDLDRPVSLPKWQKLWIAARFLR